MNTTATVYTECPECGNEVTEHSVTESDIVVVQCTVCAFEDAV